MAEEFENGEVYILTDEDGKENKFELLGTIEVDGVEYYALVPLDEESDEYVILRRELDEHGEDVLVTIMDDDEFDRIADIFDDELFSDVDYDNGGEPENKE